MLDAAPELRRAPVRMVREFYDVHGDGALGRAAVRAIAATVGAAAPKETRDADIAEAVCLALSAAVQ